VPKKPKRPEVEIRAMIVTDAKMRLGCADFAPEFTLVHVTDAAANWDVGILRDAADWPRDCAQALREAVARARRKFDVAWL
jgi:hypothetical protein